MDTNTTSHVQGLSLGGQIIYLSFGPQHGLLETHAARSCRRKHRALQTERQTAKTIIPASTANTDCPNTQPRRGSLCHSDDHKQRFQFQQHGEQQQNHSEVRMHQPTSVSGCGGRTTLLLSAETPSGVIPTVLVDDGMALSGFSAGLPMKLLKSCWQNMSSVGRERGHDRLLSVLALPRQPSCTSRRLGEASPYTRPRTLYNPTVRWCCRFYRAADHWNHNGGATEANQIPCPRPICGATVVENLGTQGDESMT